MGKMDTIAKVLRDEYMGLGYIASDALGALWTDYRDTDGFAEYCADIAVSLDEMFRAVTALAVELAFEMMSAPADIDGVATFRD